MQFYYETPRLILKVLKADHTNAAQVLDFFLRDQELFELYEPARVPNYYTSGFQRSILKHEYNLAMNELHTRYYVYRKENPDQIIGTVCFHNIQQSYYGRCEVGYKFSSEFHHQGYAKEAMNYALLSIFEETAVHRVNAWVETDNEPSIKLLERLGFEREALCKEYIYLDGAWRDHYQYVMLKPF